MKTTEQIVLNCFHCGNTVNTNSLSIDNGADTKYFCCSGCKMVYELLNEHQLCTYYDLNGTPGQLQNKTSRADKYAFLDSSDIQNKLISFKDDNMMHVVLYLPQIHCSSCLWLLENISKLNDGIQSSRVDFTRKEVLIVFNYHSTSLRQVVETLDKIGYEPHLSLNDASQPQAKSPYRKRWYKIGVAGFCFGNIMMMSFADYLAVDNAIDPIIAKFFKGASLLLALPVLFYSASEFFVGAWQGLKNKFLNIDVPVALALVITFTKSIVDIFSGSGSGYLDSMTGIVFFMLIGRWLQSRTYQTIAFDRDYKSFFPIAINVIQNGTVIPTQISDIKENDVLQIHSNEIIPVDAILSKGTAVIDYSFVSGESLPVRVNIGEIIYAGGKQTAGLIELLAIKEVSQSYLTGLWNNPVFNKSAKPQQTIYDRIAKYFTYGVLLLGFMAGFAWFIQGDTSKMWNAITTVLIVACPCALLLSHNYTNGNILRHLRLNKFYLRSAEVIDAIASVNHIVLDKTGTITQTDHATVSYSGTELNATMRTNIAALLHQSSHPAAQSVVKHLNIQNYKEVINFKETEGSGIEGWINDQHYKLGSPAFTQGAMHQDSVGTKIIVKIDDRILGEFIIGNTYRSGIAGLIQSLKKHYKLSLLSGDNNAEAATIETMMGKDSEILFDMGPVQKMQYIRALKLRDNRNVMMVGDGLNDAGALKQSNVGIAVADDSNTFTPASDAVIDGTQLPQLQHFIRFAKAGRKIIFITFTISALYNIIGLYFAVQGILSPVIAAILMPCSSITIIAFTYGLTTLAAKKYHLLNSPITKLSN
ncbi:MAG: heavy metal translocating P-type ATPase metal-binding domain-containing protein [Bacteroidota bacterium]